MLQLASLALYNNSQSTLTPKISTSQISLGAGEGNRTPVVSLEGFCSAIELHPPEKYLPNAAPLNTCDGGGSWIRTNVGVRQRVYSPSPLATRAPLQAPFANIRLLRMRNMKNCSLLSMLNKRKHCKKIIIYLPFNIYMQMSLSKNHIFLRLKYEDNG